jgi:hypothetical protein
MDDDMMDGDFPSAVFAGVVVCACVLTEARSWKLVGWFRFCYCIALRGIVYYICDAMAWKGK